MTVTPQQAVEIAKAKHRAGEHAAAEALCRQILEQEPRHGEALRLLWQMASEAGRFDDALRCVLTAESGSAAWLCDLGLTYARLDRLDEAIACYERALSLQPDMAVVHLNLGDALRECGKFDEAIACFERALALKPGYAEAHSNLATTFLSMARLDDAAASCESALRLDPQLAVAHCNLGAVMFSLGRFEEALRCQRRAIECQPGFVTAHDNLASILLLRGDYAEGWRENEWRLRSRLHSASKRKLAAPQWDGAPLPGQTLLVHDEQGFGDTIHFARYLPLVRERSRAGRVIFECHPPLTRLLAQSLGACAEVVSRGCSLSYFDRHLPLLSAPLALGEILPLAITTPYLNADTVMRAKWREQLDARARMRVGVACAGSPTHKRNRERSIAFEKVAPLLRVPGVSFVSLQLGEPHSPTLRAPLARAADFADTAALIAELDLVISVDTAIAHLAGALGRPVWTLLSFVPDWRWGLEREDTPWYPTMRLFRQPALGDWDAVVQRVADELTSARS